jgi:hypothetical protein
MSRCIFRKTNDHQDWKLAPLIIIFASAAITLEHESNNQTQWESDLNQGTGSFSQEKLILETISISLRSSTQIKCSN